MEHGGQICRNDILQYFKVGPLHFVVDEHAVSWPFQFHSMQRVDLAPSQTRCFPSDGTLLQAWVPQFWRPGQTVETDTLPDNMNKVIVRGFGGSLRNCHTKCF